MDKMLYLSERMFYQEGTTDAGYLDQCARLRNQLGGMSQVRKAQMRGGVIKHARHAIIRCFGSTAVDLDLACLYLYSVAWFLPSRSALFRVLDFCLTPMVTLRGSDDRRWICYAR